MFGVRDFSLKLTFESGQPLAFYGDYSLQGKYERLSYVTEKGLIKVHCTEHSGASKIDYEYYGNYTAKTAEDDIARRLGLTQNMHRIYAAIATDEFIRKAIKTHWGLRLTKSEPWEAALCFTVSQFNNIKRIRGIIRRLIAEFGGTCMGGDNAFRLFPSPTAIASASADELRRCGAGYRADYLRNVAREFEANRWSESIYKMNYASAKRELLRIHGIGDKVADCILLFGYGKFEAFPVDTWIKRTIEHIYFNGRRMSVKEIHKFANERWPAYAGYAQQYAFWHGRHTAVGKGKG